MMICMFFCRSLKTDENYLTGQRRDEEKREGDEEEKR